MVETKQTGTRRSKPATAKFGREAALQTVTTVVGAPSSERESDQINFFALIPNPPQPSRDNGARGQEEELHH